MTDLNPPPRIWRSNKLTVDLEQLVAVSKNDDDNYEVYLENYDFLIRRQEDGESLIQAWQEYRSVRIVGLR